MKNHWFLAPVFVQIERYVSLCQNGPSNYTLEWSFKRPVSTSLGPVFQISQNPGNHNWTDHQRAWTTTTVWYFFGPVQSGLQSFCGPRTGLLNTRENWVRYASSLCRTASSLCCMSALRYRISKTTAGLKWLNGLAFGDQAKISCQVT